MHEVNWTPSLVEERLAEAADVLKRLPEVKVRGYFNTWPCMAEEFSDLIGQEPPSMRRLSPQPAAITRMEETLDWTVGLDPVNAKIVWLRASGDRWKSICWKVGLARAAAHEHWLYALCVIAWRLNGKQHRRNVSKRRVIDETRAALW